MACRVESAADLQRRKQEIEEKGTPKDEAAGSGGAGTAGTDRDLRGDPRTSGHGHWSEVAAFVRARYEIDGYPTAERLGRPILETQGSATIKNTARGELSLDEDEPITETHRNVVKELDLTQRGISDDDVSYVAQLSVLDLSGT